MAEQIVNNEPSYVELVVEARWNITETKETITKILNTFLPGEVQEDIRSDGIYLLVRASGLSALQLLGDWVRDQQQVDTLRKRLFGSTVNNLTALYFNRQAAAMGRIALVDVEDRPPNGPIVFQIVSDGLNHVINTLTPHTYKGKIVTEEEWKEIQEVRKQKKLRNKQKE